MDDISSIHGTHRQRSRLGRFGSVAGQVLVPTVPAIIGALVILELFFRFVIPATNAPVGCFDQETRAYRACPNQGEGVATFGKFAQQRGRWRINNYGWNSPVDYRENKAKPRIAVVGDSFIEALTVDTNKAYPSLLAERLGGEYDVYRFGVSGAALSEYLNLSRYVDELFDPDILVINVVHNDFDESILALKPEYGHGLTVSLVGDSVRENQPKPDYPFVEFNWKTRWLRKSALVRYVVFNLRDRQPPLDRFSRMGRPRDVENVETDKYAKHLDEIKKATDYIVGKIAEENRDRRVVFLMGAPRQDIYNESLGRSAAFVLNEVLRDACDRHGVDLLDLTESMRRDWTVHKIKFSSPWDGHWNDHAHRLVCDELYKYLVSHGYVEPHSPVMIGRAPQ